jgi:hypothetical protein
MMVDSEAPDQRREAKRREMMARIPVRYSGRAHWIFVNTSTALGIGLCLAMLERPVWWEWLFVPGFFVFANAFEWWIHRGPMHHPTRGLRILYERHTLQHHVFYPADDMAFRDPRELFYILFPPLALPMLLVVNAPIPLLLGTLVSANIAWLFFLSVLAYYFVYEWFHYVHHLRRDSWLGRRAVVAWLRTHHTRHHELARMEKGNFNVSFPLWDWLPLERIDVRPPGLGPRSSSKTRCSLGEA